MKKQRLCLLCAIIIIGSLVSGKSHGFDKEAHRALSRRAVNPNVTNAAQLDSFLKSVLSVEFPQGIFQINGGQTTMDLIADGSVQEDSPVTRVIHHFHDPTRTWDLAGERFPPGIPLGNSSVVWSQMSPQGACCGSYAWKDARDAYLNALTSTTDSQRKLWYAKTFRTLGHLIHHVQDAAVPSHTRNDNHLQPFEFTKLPDGDPFHAWADSEVGLTGITNLTQALRFDPSILNQVSSNPLAPVPVARIIDKTDGDFGVLSPNFNIGLAEYSNANFISRGTGGRLTSYQYPGFSQLTSALEPGPNGTQRRYYRFLPGFGESNYRVAVQSNLSRYLAAFIPVDLALDDKVYEDYGTKLFPRAIGYSAGLIDYFFRGNIDLSAGQSSQGPPSNPPTTITFSLANATPDEETGTGTLRLVLQHVWQYNTSESFPPYVASNEITQSISRSYQSVTIPFSSLPFPTTMGDVCHPGGSLLIPRFVRATQVTPRY